MASRLGDESLGVKKGRLATFAHPYVVFLLIGICDTMRCRLQQLTEFDCFVKSFTYLAARLPRSEFLEAFLDEATVEPIETMKKQMAMFVKMQDQNLSTAMEEFDASALMAGMQLATGRPSEDALQAGDVPLSEAEPDMYPCLLALVGSGYGFMKVSIISCHHFYHAILIPIQLLHLR